MSDSPIVLANSTRVPIGIRLSSCGASLIGVGNLPWVSERWPLGYRGDCRPEYNQESIMSATSTPHPRPFSSPSPSERGEGSKAPSPVFDGPGTLWVAVGGEGIQRGVGSQGQHC